MMMWGAGEPNLYEIIDLEDASDFIEAAACFDVHDDIEKLYKKTCVWLSTYMHVLEIPFNSNNLWLLSRMCCLRLGLSGSESSQMYNDTGAMYAFDPLPEQNVLNIKSILWGCFSYVFFSIATTDRFESFIRENALQIHRLADQNKPQYDTLYDFSPPINHRLVRRPMMDGLDEAWETRQLYHRPKRQMILWFRAQEGAHSKLAIWQQPGKYSLIGDCSGVSIDQTNHAPSYGLPYTNDSCEYLYALRSQEVSSDTMSGEGCDLVRFDLRQSIDRMRHEEVVIRNVARHTPGWFLVIKRIVGASCDETLLCSAIIQGKDHGEYLVALDLPTRKFSIMYLLRDHKSTSR